VTFRQWSKYYVYGQIGAFPYFGTQVYFPKGSSAFRAMCEQGIFERENAGILQKLCRDGSYMLDVGANLGLMALPVLSAVPQSIVVSFEPSPNTLPWLKKTISGSVHSARWQLVEKAVGSASGRADFSVSVPTEGLYDGLIYTRRSIESRRVNVDVTTVDSEWKRLGCPDVSMIKIDVEGGELDVLRGGTECLSQARPFVLLEWCPMNFQAYHVACDALFHFARERRYLLYALPAIVPLNIPGDLELQVLRTESFLMAPARTCGV
jgi:FkbM family methyltransferase